MILLIALLYSPTGLPITHKKKHKTYSLPYSIPQLVYP